MGRTARSTRENRERLMELVEGATEVFARRGYGETTMADVASHLEVAPGTLYLYFSGKEALFHLLVLHGLSESRDDNFGEIPVPTPDTEETVERVRARISRLVSTSPVSWPPREGPREPKEELRAVLLSLYSILHELRGAIVLLERSAHEWPELWTTLQRSLFCELREGLARYLSHRMREGYLHPVPDVPAAARLAIESLSHFARHERGNNPRVRETVIEVLTYGLLGEATEEGDGDAEEI